MHKNQAYFGLSPITIVILSYLIQMLEFTLIFPLYRYIIYEQSSGMLGPEIPYAERGVYLLIALIVHYLGQLISTPLVGSLADYFGRRKLFLICLGIWCACFLAGSLSIAIHSFTFFLLSRFFGGSLPSYRPLVLSVISDLYANSYQRQRAIALFSACDGLAAAFFLSVIGRVVYGTLDPMGNPILYFLLASGLAGFNFFLLYTNLPETLSAPHPFNRYWTNFLGSFKALTNRIACTRIFLLLSAYGTLNLLIMPKVQYQLNNQFPVSLFLKMFYFGLIWSACSFFMTPRLVRVMSPKKIFFLSLIFMLLLWIVAYWQQSWIYTFWEIALTGIMAGVFWPILLMFGTWQIPESLQGTMQGLLQLGFTAIFALPLFLLHTHLSYTTYMLTALGLWLISAVLFFCTHFDPILASPLKPPPGSASQFFET